MENKKAQVIYFSHGGGPLPLLGDPSHKAMNDFMKALPQKIRKPKAIIVISAHWEENPVTVQSGANPPMLYDYYGFPQETYEIEYPASGNPELAQKVIDLLKSADIECKTNEVRGFDHGLFIPLMMMYPDADIPSFQISLIKGLNPEMHIRLGNALNGLMYEDVLIVGSGFSFHNMREFMFSGNNSPDPSNDAFQDWLTEVMISEMSSAEREDWLINWQDAPSARYCHPREEHLLPLHVCAGITGSRAELIFDDFIAGKRAVALAWL